MEVVKLLGGVEMEEFQIAVKRVRNVPECPAKSGPKMRRIRQIRNAFRDGIVERSAGIGD